MAEPLDFLQRVLQLGLQVLFLVSVCGQLRPLPFGQQLRLLFDFLVDVRHLRLFVLQLQAAGTGGGKPGVIRLVERPLRF